MPAHELGQGGDGLLLFLLREGGIHHGGVQHLARSVHHRNLAAVPVSGVKPHGYETFDRGLHQQGLQVQGKVGNGSFACPVGQLVADLPLDGGEDQSVVGVLCGGLDKRRNLHGGLQCGAAHQGRAFIAGQGDAHL